jgi:hypothetical protein
MTIEHLIIHGYMFAFMLTRSRRMKSVEYAGCIRNLYTILTEKPFEKGQLEII